MFMIQSTFDFYLKLPDPSKLTSLSKLHYVAISLCRSVQARVDFFQPKFAPGQYFSMNFNPTTADLSVALTMNNLRTEHKDVRSKQLVVIRGKEEAGVPW